MAKYIMALDAGTTSNRCILFDARGKMHSVAQREFPQYFPKPGWVEHDANEIWATQLSVAVEAMQRIGATADDIAGISAKQRLFGISTRGSRSVPQSCGSVAEPPSIAIC